MNNQKNKLNQRGFDTYSKCLDLFLLCSKTAGAVALKTLVYRTDFGFDLGAIFISVWVEFKVSMENLSAKQGDLHRSFK